MEKIVRRAWVLVGFAAAGIASACAATVDASGAWITDGTVGDVNAALGAAPAGATVRIPAGTFVWNAAVIVARPVTLTGAGPGSTTIQLGPSAPTGTSGAIQLYAAATVGNFTLTGAGAATAFSAGAQSGWRITNVTYLPNGDASYFCFIAGSYGLIDSCHLTSGAGNDELVFGRGPPDSWQTAATLGSVDAVYIEDCVFDGPGYVCDANGNARFVVRFCTINGTMKVDAHGYASNTPRGVRQIEVYDNHWTYGAAGSADPTAYFAQIELRGGTGMVFDNVSDMANGHGAGWYILTDYGYEAAWPNFGSVYQTPVNYPIHDQIGTGPDSNGQKGAGGGAPLYSWHNLQAGSAWARLVKSVDPAAIALYQAQTGNPAATFAETDLIKPDRDVYLDLTVNGAFDGSTGVGRGTRAQMLALSPRHAGVGFWVTDEAHWNTNSASPSGQLYVWNGAAWVLKYTPFLYPHPARQIAAGGGGAAAGVTGAAQVGAPVIAFSAASADAGGTVLLSVPRAGAPAYQWRKDGAPLPGATGSTLALTAAGGYQSGNYAVAVTDAAGTAVSAAVPIGIAEQARLVNLSARGVVGSGASAAMYVGSVASGAGRKALLLRAVGPTLRSFGVTGSASGTALTLFDGAQEGVASDAGWTAPLLPGISSALGAAAATASDMAAAGAFALPPGSADSALRASVPPGAFTAQLNALGGAGVALAEIYDLDSGSAPAALVNLSARAPVGSGAQALIAGFVVAGTTSQTILLRAVGPALAAYGIAAPLSRPRLTLFDSGLNGAAPATIAVNSAWGTMPAAGSSLVLAGLQAATADLMSRVSAFPLPPNSADAALVATLPPGAYTVQVDSVDGGIGTALVEIYDLR